MRKRLGDTLIEVTIAIGIFSLIAIAVTSVMSSGTANSQLSLETTLAREEIDAQAEALRFIQSSYVADRGSTDQRYVKLWNMIKGKVSVNGGDVNENVLTLGNDAAANDKITKFAPTSCQELYNSSSDMSVFKQKGFILNTRMLADLNESNANQVYISAKTSPSGTFRQASTYPHLVFGSINEDNKLVDAASSNLVSAEGIYIIAVQDEGTIVADTVDEGIASKPAFFDFYIRTCWDGPGSSEASTISTVVRLYDPDVVTRLGEMIVKYANNGVSGGIKRVKKVKVPTPTPPGPSEWYVFKGWCNGTVNGITCSEPVIWGGTILYNADPDELKVYDLKAIWLRPEYQINYDLNGGTLPEGVSLPSKTCLAGENDNKCQISDINGEQLKRSGYVFEGWCTVKPVNNTCAGKRYNPGDKLSMPANVNNANDHGDFPDATSTGRKVELSAIWKVRNETITIRLDWGTEPRDLDAHVEGQKSNNSTFHAYYHSKIGSDLDGTTIAQLDQDVTGGIGPETFTINTYGGKNYYYYVYCYSGCTKITNATVTVSSPYMVTQVYRSNDATGTGRYWNVFAYKNGQIVSKQTHSNTPGVDY